MGNWTVPGYTDVREIGRSTSGWAVLATHTATGVPVVIKYLADELRKDEAYLDRYRADARRIADLDAPSIAQLYEYVESSDGVATVREYVAGASLQDLLPFVGKLRPDSALTVLKGVLQALNVCTHNGVTGHNILLGADGGVKVTDFGLNATPMGADADAAVGLFVRSVAGEAADSSRLPKRLRPLAVTPADGAQLLAGLDGIARKTCGENWSTRGRTQLAEQVQRYVRKHRHR